MERNLILFAAGSLHGPRRSGAMYNGLAMHFLFSHGRANFKVTVLRDLWSDFDVQTSVEEPSTSTFSQVPLLQGFETSTYIHSLDELRTCRSVTLSKNNSTS